ncbi:MAG: hypothetical protein [Wigfec virus K19_81]|nr:MAG: hypothetical protein [Wigfec virus K19_81]
MEASGKISKKSSTTAQNNSLDYSKGEENFKNIIIPGSQFQAKWIKDEGYAVGIENIKLTKNYKTLEEALNQIGYGVELDKDGDEILMKVGEVDYEMIARIVRALITINNENNEKDN